MLASFLLCASLLLIACSDHENLLDTSNEVIRISGQTMGTTYNVTVLIPSANRSESVDKKAIQIAIDQSLHDVNQIMSTYIEGSELSLLNDGKSNQWLKLSKPLFDVLSLSKAIHLESDGAFDVTIAPLVNLWGFGPLFSVDKIPHRPEIDDSMRYVDSNLWALDGESNSIIKHKPVQIDLSAIAKGYGVDVIAELLNDFGLHNYLVEIGGEVRVSGFNSENNLWRIGIETPVVGPQREIQKIISITDTSMATSGNYRNFFEVDGNTYSHTLDPRTGFPVKHELVSVTVLASDCARADALATAFNVMGYEKALLMANSQNIPAFFIIKSPEGFTEFTSNTFTEVTRNN